MSIVFMILLILLIFLEGFAAYVLGIISAKIDLLEERMRFRAEVRKNSDQDMGERQLRAMMNYNGNERREMD